MIKYIFLISLSITINLLLSSSIDAEQVISTDTIWEADTVKVNSDIIVENGITLTIQPSVRVKFNGDYALNIQGRLLAEGAENDSIYFTPADTQTTWAGIRFISTPVSNDSSFLKYCVVSNVKNIARPDEQIGGGISFYDFSKAVISDCYIAYNWRLVTTEVPDREYYTGGGGIYCYNSSPSILNNHIYKNRVNTFRFIDGTENYYSNLYGCGILCIDSSPLIRGNTITENKVYVTTAEFHAGIISDGWNSFGGGIFCVNSEAEIRENMIMENTLEAGGMPYGGGIACKDSDLKIINNEIIQNSVLFIYTSSYGCGGAIYLDNSNGLIVNNLLYRNSACSGAALYFKNSSPQIINNTMLGNGGMSSGDTQATNIDIVSSSPVFYNNILWSSYFIDYEKVIKIVNEDSAPEFYCNNQHYGQEGIFHYDDNGTTPFTGIYENNINEDPQFESIEEKKFFLTKDSPCLDAGITNIEGYTFPEYDLIGNQRIWGDGIDMGAYEWSGTGSIESGQGLMVSEFKLQQNYPNPFNPTTTINYELATANSINLVVFNAKGESVWQTGEKRLEAGRYAVQFDGYALNSGIYFYSLKIGGVVKQTKKMMLVK